RRRAGGPRRRDRLGRAGADGGARPARHRRLVLRALERLMARQVTSLSNPTVKAARALHMKQAREETGQFLAEGLKIVTEALEAGRAPRVLLFAAEAASHPLLRRVIAATEAAKGEVIEVNHEILGKISRRDNPQTVLAVFDQAFTPLAELDPSA